MAKRIQVGGRIESKEVGGIVTGAAEILDDAKGKKQSVINQETDDELVRLDQSKQDNLTFDNAPTEGSNNPVKSGGLYTAQQAILLAIAAINELIPSSASALNQLADKAFVNSSISTNTATFRGTSAAGLNEQQFLAWANGLEHDLNDYVFWQTSDAAGNTLFKRYKWNGTEWAYEYTLNNSTFTAEQWEAIQSGITALLVAKLRALPTAQELIQSFDSKQNVLTFDDVPTLGSTNPVKSSGIFNAIKEVSDALDTFINETEALIPAEATAQNQLADKADVAAKIVAAIPSWKGQYDTLTDLQAVTGAKAGDMGCVKTTDSDGHAVLMFYQYSAQGAWVEYYTLRHYAQNKPATTGTTGDYPYNGMGRIELQKNIVNGVNTLTQAMLTQQNTIYVIQYDFTLGENITVPVGCVLEFDGGSISGNGTGKDTITGNNTIINTVGDYESLIDVIEYGTFKTYGKIEQDDINRVLSSTEYRICGHRGFPNSPTRPSPDNSIVAIEEAARYGFSGIETDPRKDKDGVIVLLHNDTVDSVSTSTGYIRDLSYENVLYKNIYGDASNIHLTTLSEAVAICKMYNMFILFDNKGVVTIDELIAFMEDHEYYNFGIFNYTETELATIPDKYIRIIEPKSSVTALEETLAKFSTKKNIWMRVYGLNYITVPVEVVNKCKEYGIKILCNKSMGTSTDKQYLVDAVDCFIVDNQLTEYDPKECIMLRSDAGEIATANNDSTYNDAIWSIRTQNTLVHGYHWSGCQETKFPGTKDIFVSGSYCLSFMTRDRFVNIHIDGSKNSNRIVLEKFYNGIEENNRTSAEIVTNENAQEFANNLIVGKNIDCTTITKSGVYLIFSTEGCTNRPSTYDGVLIVSYGIRNNINFVYKKYIDSKCEVFEAIQWGRTDTITWNQVVTCINKRGGTSNERPQSPLKYDCYFDITVNKPIWYNGTGWVDATGATV